MKSKSAGKSCCGRAFAWGTSGTAYLNRRAILVLTGVVLLAGCAATGNRGKDGAAAQDAGTTTEASAAAPAAAPATPAIAAAPDACPGEIERQFDFALGHWDVVQRIQQESGEWIELPAESRVEKTLGGCAIVEHWAGQVQFFWVGMQAPQPLHRLTMQTFDPAQNRWQVRWMDSGSRAFSNFSGGFNDNGVGLFYQVNEGADGIKSYSRIAIGNISADAYDWEFAASADAEEWRTLWAMRLTRKGADGGAP